MPARVRFVVAAGPAIGRGHLARALSLAEADWGSGAELELELVGDDTPLTDGERARLAAVDGTVVDAGAPVGAGTTIVVDVPEPDAVFARFDPARLAVFDDREAFTGTAAVVIQPSLPAWGGRAAAGRVLAGFDVVPISAAIRDRRGAGLAPTTDLTGRRHRVVVCFGGSDPDRVTERLTPALVRAIGEDADVDVVIGASYRGPTDGWPIEPLRDPPDFVDRLANADVVVAGAGTMKFEGACLGRPMLLVAAADDQRPAGPAFAATGAARYLGDGRTVDPDAVAAALVELLDDDGARAALADTAARVVDGGGADRIAAVVAGLVSRPAARRAAPPRRPRPRSRRGRTRRR